MLLCCWKLFYMSLEKSVPQEMLLHSWEQFYASLDESVPQEILWWDYTVSRSSVLNIPAIIWTGMWRALLYPKAKANLEKGTPPQMPQVLKPHLPIRLLIKDSYLKCFAKWPWILNAILQSMHLKGLGFDVDGAPNVALMFTLLKWPTDLLCFWRWPLDLKNNCVG